MSYERLISIYGVRDSDKHYSTAFTFRCHNEYLNFADDVGRMDC